ncbi:c-type cytochrome [Endothiovibrio diazotrophicus]
MQIRPSLSLIGASLLSASLIPGIAAAASANGSALFSNYCQNCHGTPSSPWGWSATTISGAISRNRGGMGSLSFLTSSQLSEIAAYLADPNGSVTTTVADSSTGTATSGTSSSSTPSSGTSSPSTPSSGSTSSFASQVDGVFDWAEATYPFLFSGSTGSQTMAGYYFRHYPEHDVFLAIRGDRFYFYDGTRPQDGMLDLGTVTEWFARAGATPTTASGSDDYTATSSGANDDNGYSSSSSYGSDDNGYSTTTGGDDGYSSDGHHGGDDGGYEREGTEHEGHEGGRDD